MSLFDMFALISWLQVVLQFIASYEHWLGCLNVVAHSTVQRFDLEEEIHLHRHPCWWCLLFSEGPPDLLKCQSKETTV